MGGGSGVLGCGREKQHFIATPLVEVSTPLRRDLDQNGILSCVLVDAGCPYRTGIRRFHQLDTPHAIGLSNIALTTHRDGFAVRRFVRPTPFASIIAINPVGRVGSV